MGIRPPGNRPLKRSAALLVLLLLGAAVAQAAPASRAFDRGLIHADYQAGDFDKVISSLERFLASGRPCRREDSVFVAKHLAVVYAANPATRERGRYHMLRMLALDPDADLLDMFVGEEVDRIFEKVRREAEVRRPAPPAPRKAAAAAARPAATPRNPPGAASRPAGPSSAARPKVSLKLPPERPASAGLEPWSLDPPAERSGRQARAASARVPGPDRSPSADPPGRRSPPPESAPGSPSARPPAAPDPTPDPNPIHAAAVADSAGRPRWQDPGFWIGGGAAVAVVGLTLFLSGDGEKPASKPKIYAVPARPNP